MNNNKNRYRITHIEIATGLHYSVDDGTPWYVRNDKFIPIKTYSKYNYYRVRVNGNQKLWHRHVYETFNLTTIPPKMQIDHVDNDSTNNLMMNLRLATHVENNRNQNKKTGCNTPYKGVSLRNNNKYKAVIHYNGEYKYLGQFQSAIDAAKEYDKWALIYFKEFALTNKKLGLI